MGFFIPPPQPSSVIRSWDDKAIREFSIPGLILMENAGEGCVRTIEDLMGDPSERISPPFQIICGFGNNGGDGFVIARHLFNRGIPVQVYLTAPSSKINPASDAGINLGILRTMGVPLQEPPASVGLDSLLEEATSQGTLVDAIFGSGLVRPIRSPQGEWIEAMNGSGRPILAVDIPSGLDADSGDVLGVAIHATHTFTFVAPKLGFLKAEGPSRTGNVHVISISIPRSLLAEADAR